MSMLDDLIAYWSLDEASGNAIDAHGSNDLTETSGTIASATGKVGNCRDFELGDTEFFTINDNTDLSVGDIDFSLAFWVNLETGAATTQWPLAKETSDGNRSYGVRLDDSAKRWQFRVSANGTAIVNAQANNAGEPSTATWYLVICWHDSVANTINIQVNDGTANSTSHSTGVFDGTSVFRLGAHGSGVQHLDGLLDEVAFAKRVWTADERTWIYNSGNGRSYADWAATAATGNRRRRLICGAAA